MGGEGETLAVAPSRAWVGALLRHGYNLRMLNELRRALAGQVDRALLTLAVWLSSQAESADAHARQLALGALRAADLVGEDEVPNFSLRHLARVLGLPRETTRRSLHELADEGWLREGGVNRALLPAAKLQRWLSHALGPDFLGDLLWTAERIADATRGGVLAPTSIGAIEGAMRACRSAELPPGLRPRIALPSADAATALHCAILLGGYHLRQAVAVRRAFDGDILQALLLGEIAHYCYGPLALARPAATWAELETHFTRSEFVATARAEGRLRVCTSHSLALSMDFAAETMRRKLAALAGRGWILRDDEGCWWPASGLGAAFAEFDKRRALDFDHSAASILAILEATAPRAAA